MLSVNNVILFSCLLYLRWQWSRSHEVQYDFMFCFCLVNMGYWDLKVFSTVIQFHFFSHFPFFVLKKHNVLLSVTKYKKWLDKEGKQLRNFILFRHIFYLKSIPYMHVGAYVCVFFCVCERELLAVSFSCKNCHNLENVMVFVNISTFPSKEMLLALK